MRAVVQNANSVNVTAAVNVPIPFITHKLVDKYTQIMQRTVCDLHNVLCMWHLEDISVTLAI